LWRRWHEPGGHLRRAPADRAHRQLRGRPDPLDEHGSHLDGIDDFDAGGKLLERWRKLLRWRILVRFS
jgi:hypothetical protein